jgi:hypothetical protein
VKFRNLLGIASLMVLAGSTATFGGSLIMRSDLPGTFTDIRFTGTRLAMPDDGSVPVVITVSNDLFPAGTVWVGNNGGVGFTGNLANPLPSTVLAPGPAPLPSSLAFGGGQCALPWWDNPGEAAIPDGVYFQESGGVAIFQWQNMPLSGGGRVTFQFKIVDGGFGKGINYGQYIYSDVTEQGGGLLSTVGYQDGTNGEFNDVLWGFRGNPFQIQDGTVLTLANAVPAPSVAAFGLIAGWRAARRRR